MRYNIGLVKAGISAFVLYVVAAVFVKDPEFEITAFTTLFQGIGYLIMMGIANVCYLLGPGVDYIVNRSNSEIFRERLFQCGYWFLFGLPFLVPLMVVVVSVFFSKF